MSAIHLQCEARHSKWRTRFAFASILCTLVLSFFVVQHITYTQQIAILNKKTATVAADAIAVSDTALIMTDERGTIVKSSAAADQMFASGADIEGRNVHDWCVDAPAAKRASDMMQRWYANATTGSRRVLVVSASLPAGRTDIFITITALRREPGSEIKMLAFINYLNQISYSDLRNTRSEPAGTSRATR